MHFASPLPAWLVVVIVLGIAGVAIISYRRTLVPLSRERRVGLALLRALSIATLVLILARPTVDAPPGARQTSSFRCSSTCRAACAYLMAPTAARELSKPLIAFAVMSCQV